MENVIVSDEAYKYNGGPILLLAGPGTGKTWQLAQRIKFLTTEKGVMADDITVITFTTEAAKGMQLKIEEKGSSEYIEKSDRPSRIFTMHSLGHRVISENPNLAGLKKGFIVIEKDEIRKPLMRDAAILLGYTEKDATKALQDRTTANIALSEESKKIIKKYEEILRFCNAIDHDDQISLVCSLFEKNEKLRKKYAKNAKHLLVDEYQDINQAQFNLINLLSKDNREGLFVVGDDDQSIYSFRGGDPKYIRNFRSYFGQDSIVIQMRTSRRCPRNILECASCIVADFDPQRVKKGDYVFIKSDPGNVVLHDCPSDDREAEIVAAILKDENDHLNTCEYCNRPLKQTYFILVPNKNYASKIQEVLKKYKVPFESKFKDGKKGFSMFIMVKEWLISPSSNFVTRQVIEYLAESGVLEQLPSSRSKSLKKLILREGSLKKVASYWDNVVESGRCILDILEKKSRQDNFSKEIYEKLSEIRVAYEKGSIPDFLQKVCLDIKPWSSIEIFFEDIENKTVASINQVSLNVRILTAQGSKGLQAHTVFIIGLEQDVIPREVTTKEALAEEARLFFVAMTRAERRLHLFKSRRRVGASTYKPIPHDRQPSSFIAHLPINKHEKQFHPAKGKIKK